MGRISSLRLRFGLLGLVAALATFGFGSSASAQIVVGQTAPDLLQTTFCDAPPGYDEAQVSLAGGASYAVPTAGVLTSWSTNSGAGGQLGLKVFRPVAGAFLVLAADGPRTLAPGAVNTFPVSIPVQPGDVVGQTVPPGAKSNCLAVTTSPADVVAFNEGSQPVGSTFSFEESESENRLNIAATLLPPPAISSLSPAKGSIAGEKVTIAGTNFASVSAVAFGGVAAKSFTVDSEGQITATAPASKKLAKVQVAVTTVAGTATSATTYAYEGCKVPNLAGKKLKASKKKASKADCKIGKVTKKDGATGKTGKVTKQNPKAGKVLAPGTKIKVTLEP